MTPEEKETPAAKSALLPFQKRRQLERDIDHITQEMYRRNKELAETNKTLSLLRTIDALALEMHASLNMVCEHITEAITQATDYAFVGLLTKASHAHEELALNGWSGSAWLGKEVPPSFSRPLHMRLDYSWFGEMEKSKMISLKDLSEEELVQLLDCSHQDILRLKRQSKVTELYLTKLMARRQLVGLLVVGFGPGEQLQQSDADLIDRLSESIGVALDNKLLFKENQYVLRKLRESNMKLRTLDETKDDFISMASHQLRTPLTSIKGYLSMIIEGDVGKVNPTQLEMLTQAFTSSQRMVYLIADLLNVSRLRTGKFVIDTTPVSLADMVEQELSQLNEAAKARSIKLIYKKPTDFPELMLDETKTRQVIMNFVDNAIYYTPPKGRIEVKLIQTPSSIEFRVEDNGIGVPKHEQPHLFTKFYRAGNARKARPDGTGLGLFMAKKVIVAQGGSLIFESKEGKGSTFGFVFSKHRLAVPEVTTPIAPAKAKAEVRETAPSSK
ncbi:MAG: hypothetical protein JWL89_30 [Candidatus Saccharibacteria bacterium]|nr:hypothetical protein [Candidatus Saccharibacteria bacterium]